MAVFFALVLLPCVLVLFGRWVFWPQVPKLGQAQLADSTSLWRRIGDTLAKRPSAFIAGALVLLVMGLGLTQVKTGLSQTDQFLDKPEAISAAERIAESFPAGSSDPVVIITEGPGDSVASVAERVDDVASARVGASADGLTRVDVVLDAAPSSEQAAQAIRELRTELGGDATTFVGGSEAQSLDSAEGSARDRALIIPLILGLVLVALILLLRSIVAPLILVTTVVATYLAALGASWWLFTGVFGFEALDDGAPLLSFLFLVALGVDYNIFLVTRTWQEAKIHGSHEGMIRSPTATGGVITSAGILLAAVFAVLGVLPLVVLAQIGAIICIGVLLDTLVVRTVLVPAIALVLRDKFWWPRKLPPEARQAAMAATHLKHEENVEQEPSSEQDLAHR